MWDNFLCDSAEALHSAADNRALLQKTFLLTRRLGFDHFVYALKVGMHLNRPHFLVFSGFPQAWVDHYLGENYFESDPVMAQAMQSSLPLSWNEDFFIRRQRRRIWEEAASHGLSHGLSFAVHEGRGLAGVFTVARDRPITMPGVELANLFGHAQFLAGSIHQSITRTELLHAVPEAAIELTDRERECLRWAADGKTAWEIGQILRISERTAIFHLNNCMSKLGAVNKTQAVVRAMTLGLLGPRISHAGGVPLRSRSPGRRMNAEAFSAEVHAL